MGFIRINNRSNFLLKDIPKLHPKSASYLRYWKNQKKRCIEGFWSQDEKDVQVDTSDIISQELLGKRGGWRYMPGNLYFYVNFTIILHKDDRDPKTAPKRKMRPLLRDVEWEFFYNWIEARGFSGFEDDNEFTCNWSVVSYTKDNSIDIDKSCYKSDGTLKIFVTPREYLRRLHDRPLGIPLYENQANNLLMLGSRGFGKSFMVGNGVILYELTFDGARRYDEESIKNPYKVEVFVGSSITSKSSDLLSKTREAFNNLPGTWGEGTDDFEPSPLSKRMSGTLGPNNMKNPWRHEYLKKVGGEWVPSGTGSNIKHGIFTTENPEAAVGTRPGVIVVEEVGLCENILAVHGANTACQKEGTTKFGSSLYLGTGGNIDKVQETEIIFRDPIGFDFLSFDDEWEGTGKIGWFVPAIYSYNQFKDENGNTDVEAATRYVEKERKKKQESKDLSALALEMMNYPMIPSEMFLNAKNGFFPQAELKSHLAEVKNNPHRYENSHYFGELVWNSKGELEWEDGSSNYLVREFPIKDNKNKPGIIEVFEMPQKDSNRQVFKNRYIQGTDTYDDDESTTTSLGSTFIMDLWTSRIVAEYTGRRLSKEFFEITRKMNIFYNAVHNYEQNKKGLYSYFEQKKSIHWLCDTPESLKDIADITISKVGNRAKGTYMSTPLIAYGLRLILDYLMEPAYGSENQEIKNLHTLRSQGLLNELIGYHSKGNFDRVSALILLLILREELHQYQSNVQQDKVKSLAQDDFWKRNFDPSKSKFKVLGVGVKTDQRKREMMQFDTLLRRKENPNS